MGRYVRKTEGPTWSKEALNEAVEAFRSDVEELELYPEPQSSRNISNHWTTINIEKAIKRGNRLRKNKCLPTRTKDRPKIVSFKNQRNNFKQRKRQILQRSNNNNQCCSDSLMLEQSYPESNLPPNMYPENKNVRTKAKKQIKCSMRTVALAVPSKRHCLETWRTKSYILPDFMIERLKQQVTDQRPVVQITDSIHCYRRRKPRLHKKPAKKPDYISNIHIPLRCADTQTLCLLFAKKIIQKLLLPQNIKLNSYLENIYRIVSYDIALMIKHEQTIQEHERQNQIHSDVSRQVTIWIAGILEDLKYKLLEADLLDLEAEEGPVLDFLDEVVNKVWDICAPKLPSIDIDDSDYFDSLSTSEFIYDESRQYPDNKSEDNNYFENEICKIINNFNEVSENLTLTNKEFSNESESLTLTNEKFNKEPKSLPLTNEKFNNEPENLTITNEKFSNVPESLTLTNEKFNKELENLTITNDKFNNEPKNFTLTNEKFEKEPEILTLTNEKFNKKPESPTLTDEKYFQNELNNIINIFFNKHKKKLTDTEYFENVINDLLRIIRKERKVEINEGNETVSISTLEDTDDRSKKVMFSVLDIEEPTHPGSLRKTNAGLNKEHKENYLIKRNIYFAEPNAHLLSNADELWPQDIASSHLLRPSASVTKSIISLGKLWEKDEKEMTTSQTDASVTGLENQKPNGKVEDIEILKSVTSLANMLQEREKSELNHYTDDKLKIIQDIEILKSMTSLEKMLQDGENQIMNEANTEVGSINKLHDIEIFKSMTLLAKVLQDGEKKILNVESADINGKLNKIQDIEMLKSMTSLAKTLQDGGKKPLNEASTDIINSKSGSLYAESQAVIQNDDNHLTPKEVHVIIPEILNQLTNELTNVDVINVLQNNQDDNIVEKLTLLDDESILNKELTKSIASLAKTKDGDENYMNYRKHTAEMFSLHDVEAYKVGLQKLKSNDTFTADKCDAQIQTNQLKTLEVVVLEPTGIGGVDLYTVINNDIGKNIPVQEKRTIIADDVPITTDTVKNNVKLDDEWKVHFATAPSWIAQTNAHGEPSEYLVPFQSKIPTGLTQYQIRKWCKDMDKGYKNLEIWRDWLLNTCKEATSLLKKKNSCSFWKHKHVRNWKKLQNNVAKDAAVWRKMNQRTHYTFQKYYGNITIILPAKTKPRCACKDKFYVTQYRNA